MYEIWSLGYRPFEEFTNVEVKMYIAEIIINESYTYVVSHVAKM